jgi:hypothetical protein
MPVSSREEAAGGTGLLGGAIFCWRQEKIVDGGGEVCGDEVGTTYNVQRATCNVVCYLGSRFTKQPKANLSWTNFREYLLSYLAGANHCNAMNAMKHVLFDTSKLGFRERF